MKQIIFTSILSFSLATAAMAQEKLWTMDECMHYAIENSPKVKKQAYTSDSYKAELNSAVASFKSKPSVRYERYPKGER